MRNALKYTLLVVAGLAAGIGIQRFGIVGNYIKPLFSKEGSAVSSVNLPEINISLKEKDWDKLLLYTDSARMAGVIKNEYKKDYKAQLNNLPCELRLKGDWADHATRAKPSLRITMGDSVNYQGLQRFALQSPATRNHLYEWLTLNAYRAEGIIAPNYSFIKLNVNGKSLGIYALEQGLDKILLEGQNNREAPIIKFDEAALWQERSRSPNLLGNPTGQQSSTTAAVIPVQDKRVLKDSMLLSIFTRGAGLLNGFREGKLPASKAFDVNKLATFFALGELLGARHATALWHNLRFYCNPLTGLLEPVAFDCNPGVEIKNILGIGTKNDTLDPFYQRLFADTGFMRLYTAELARVAKDSYLDKLINNNKQGLDTLQTDLVSEFSEAKFSVNPIKNNLKTICLTIHPKTAVVSHINYLHNNGVELSWANVQPLPLQIKGIWWGDTLLPLPSQPIVQGTTPNSLPTFQTLKLDLPKGKPIPKKLKLAYILGYNGFTGKDNVIPFSRGAYGTALPQNVYYLSKTDTLRLTNRVFSGLAQPTLAGFNITGAITVYGGVVIIDGCTFDDCQAEDALNLINCNFTLKNCTFKNCPSDGFDADFCTGNIINCKAYNCKNDGFDVSGSRVTFTNVTATTCGDKGLSIGEASTATINSATIAQCTTGIAVKDNSNATINQTKITESKTGLALYQKKPEFGSATATLKNTSFYQCQQDKNIAPGSTLR